MNWLGPGEIIMILLVALVLFGPKSLPELGRLLGKTLREVRKFSEMTEFELEETLKNSDVRNTKAETSSRLPNVDNNNIANNSETQKVSNNVLSHQSNTSAEPATAFTEADYVRENTLTVDEKKSSLSPDTNANVNPIPAEVLTNASAQKTVDQQE